ncbi:hypothetical protein, partial [Streptomyces jumonjinensis]
MPPHGRWHALPFPLLAPEGILSEAPGKRLEQAIDHAYEGDGLIGACSDTACVLTGIDCGTVLLSVHLTSADPGPDPGPWEETEETDLAAPSGDL